MPIVEQETNNTDTKKCFRCKQDLSLDKFSRSKNSNDGLQSYCKVCKKEYYQINKEKIAIRNKESRQENKELFNGRAKKYYQKNKEKITIRHKKYNQDNKENIKIQKRDYRFKNREEILKQRSLYNKNNPDKVHKHNTTTRKKIKKEVFSYYCGGDIKCVHCGELEIDVLVIDHINGDGSKHRKEIGINGGYIFYFWLRNNGFPYGFQVLCFNCNLRKKNAEVANKNPTKDQARCCAYIKKLKSQCLEHYGGICKCGISELAVLTLDHVNNDGADHRRKIDKYGCSFYSYLKKHNFPNDPPLQVLCMNCNFRKRVAAEKQRKELICQLQTTIAISVQ